MELSDTQLDALRWIKDNQGAHTDELPQEYDETFDWLRHNKLIRCENWFGPGLPTWFLTEDGRALLEKAAKADAEREKREADKKAAETKRLAERADDRAREERYHATQNKIAIIMPLITFFLGMIFEHFARIIDFFSRFFH